MKYASTIFAILTAAMAFSKDAPSFVGAPPEVRAWHILSATDPDHDLAFSPLGLCINLAMLGEGTGGETRAIIAENLNILSDFGSSYHSILDRYSKANVSNSLAATFAPSIWTRQWRKMDREYILSLQRNFQAETGTLLSSLPINAWTEAKTDGRITSIIDDIPMTTEILLLSAVSFEGAWQMPFHPIATRNRPFHRADGSTVDITTMRGNINATIVSNAAYTAISIPYQAKGFSMVHVIPVAGTSLAECQNNLLAGGALGELKLLLRTGSGDGVKSALFDVTIPKLDITSSMDSFGSLAAFKVPVSGYGRISNDFKVNMMRHAASIRTGEAHYSLTPGVLPPQKKKEKKRNFYDDDDDEEEKKNPVRATGSFVCDRPFIWFVLDEESDTIPIAGRFTGLKRP